MKKLDLAKAIVSTRKKQMKFGEEYCPFCHSSGSSWWYDDEHEKNCPYLEALEIVKKQKKA